MNQWNCSEVNVRANILGKNLPIIGIEMWYVFDFSWKIVVIIVQRGSKLYDLTVVAAGVETNKFVIRAHHVSSVWTEGNFNLNDNRNKPTKAKNIRIHHLTFLTRTTKRSCSQFRGCRQNGKTKLKQLGKRFNSFYMASDLYLNIWSCWNTELQQMQVKQ